jgi:glycosyltransferase involved in cell wall biosynthesis
VSHTRRRLRVGFITDIPTPYRDPLLERLHRRESLDLRVIYCASSFVDRHWQLPSRAFPARVLARRGFVVRGSTVLTYLVQPEIVGLVWRSGFDLLFVSSFAQPTSLLAMASARLRGVPYAIVCESHDRRERSRALQLFREPFLRRVIGGAAGGLAVGSLARQHLRRYGLQEDRIFLFPNTPDVERFRREAAAAHPHREETRRRLATPPGAPVAVYVGRLLAVKDVPALVAAWGRVVEELPEAVLWVVGEGPQRQQLVRQAARVCPGAVRFLGHRQQEELPSLYAAADLFVLPSLDEPWGVVVNEAGATGLPLVTSDRVGAAADLVLPGETGFTFPAGDREALARVLLEVLRRPDRGAALGHRAQALVAGWGYDLAESQFLAAVEALAAPARPGERYHAPVRSRT